ncbi:hypothetical protein RHSIM_Rhsim05G0072300 [Rhododendron simsii]|uniref:ATPase AAA-type core domain-containing protein n=1 Tax=Rhododendron simsii TaxID=118357 RepID=A0A834GU68_RHOSS|nr:hypothetical protein RHSIM_Rhsim05G0072300 [Rhododendron simsii]
MVLRSLAKDLIPREFRHELFLRLHMFLSRFSNELTLTVDEYDGLYPNTLLQPAKTYLGSIITPNTKRFRASKPEREKRIKVSMEKDEELTDWFGGVPIKWQLFCKDTQGKYVANPDSSGYGYGAVTQKLEARWFELVFRKKIKDKQVLPGTGKSSLIAAMANYLNLDVYDLELAAMRSNFELRNLLISKANQSILVVEDIDCSIELQGRIKAAPKVLVGRDPFQYGHGSTGVTLSGLLNFIDGLWSSCGDEASALYEDRTVDGDEEGDSCGSRRAIVKERGGRERAERFDGVPRGEEEGD